MDTDFRANSGKSRNFIISVVMADLRAEPLGPSEPMHVTFWEICEK
jgi:hypothetical protein